MDEHTQELTNKLYTAFGLISKLAHAADIMLTRLSTLETTVARLEAEATLRKASGK